MVDNNVGNNLDRDHLHKYNFVGGSSGSGGDHEYYGIIKEQDRLLPIANVGRIMKQILPSNAKISKEAKETMQECVSEFISFVTGEASDKCHKEKRKTVNGDDICWALSTLGFDNYSDQLKIYLHKYRELEGERASQNKAGNTDHHHLHHQGKEESTGGFNGEPPPRKHTLHPFKFNNMPDRSNSSTRF